MVRGQTLIHLAQELLVYCFQQTSKWIAQATPSTAENTIKTLTERHFQKVMQLAIHH